MKPGIRVSVLVCTHNPRPDYFGRCLEALERQTLDRREWELIVVDNASAKGREPAAVLGWHPNARLLQEPALGLTPARLRAIRESLGELLIFVDDDNVLDPDYLASALKISLEMPHLGAWSGQCRPEFEVAPEPWTRRYWGNLVIREFDRDVWSNLPRLAASMPCGAGLCVRRSVARHYLWLHETGQRAFQIDRTGTNLLSGGDNDLAACACDIGAGVGLLARLRLTHLIPADRLTADYLARLAEGIYFSSVVIADFRASHDELRSYRVRWHEYLRVSLMRRPHRTIHAAGLRGRRLGLRAIGAGGGVAGTYGRP